MDLDPIFFFFLEFIDIIYAAICIRNFSCVISRKWFSSENFIPAVRHLQIESCADRFMDSHTTRRLVYVKMHEVSIFDIL